MKTCLKIECDDPNMARLRRAKEMEVISADMLLIETGEDQCTINTKPYFVISEEMSISIQKILENEGHLFITNCYTDAIQLERGICVNRIKELRKQHNWTQEQLGNMLQVQKSAISKYEKEKLSLTRDIIIKLSEIFGVTADYLLGNDNQTRAIGHQQEKVHLDELYLLLRKLEESETVEESIAMCDNIKIVLNDIIRIKKQKIRKDGLENEKPY